MRASRLVSLLLLLQTRGRMTAATLAEELEVSVRTIYRDLEALSSAGVPVYAERGPHGGCQLVDGYRTRLTGLTAPEAEALFLSGVAAPVGDLGLGTVLAAAQLKVLAALPPELRGRATRVRERFHLDAPGWFRRAEDVPHLGELAEAMWAERRVQVRYRRGERTVDRVLEPLGLVLKAGVWYVVAAVPAAADTTDTAAAAAVVDTTAAVDTAPRTYRVSRVVEARTLDERFDRPLDFDLGAHWAASSTRFEEQLMRVRVEARIDADGVGALVHVLDPGSARSARASLGDAGDDGWAPVVIPAESVEVAHWALLRLGPHIEVLTPIELRERLAAGAHALAERYGRAHPAER